MSQDRKSVTRACSRLSLRWVLPQFRGQLTSGRAIAVAGCCSLLELSRLHVRHCSVARARKLPSWALAGPVTCCAWAISPFAEQRTLPRLFRPLDARVVMRTCHVNCICACGTCDGRGICYRGTVGLSGRGCPRHLASRAWALHAVVLCAGRMGDVGERTGIVGTPMLHDVTATVKQGTAWLDV